MNVAYTSGPKLRDFEDDIYAYGEMDTDPQATWKHSNDRMVLGKVLHTGRFAEIRSGTLKNKEGSRPVAVKILRGMFASVNDSNTSCILGRFSLQWRYICVPYD